MLQAAMDIGPEPISAGLSQLSSGLDADTIAASQLVSQQVATSEWLGPLAPIAISPFFGLALLSGGATYGPDWLQERSALFNDASPLNNPILFWIMLALAVLTSLPRFTKVSKPIALAADNLEAYSAIIIMIVVRFLMTGGDPTVSDTEVDQQVMLSAGFAAVSLNVALTAFAALNIFVINIVKLLFEFMVWLVPFPTVDAILEIGNKFTCALLTGLYTVSPLAATVVNLLLLFFCMMIFGWTYRRLVYYREIIAGPLMAWLLPAWFSQRGDRYGAFVSERWEKLPKYSRVVVESGNNGEVEVRGRHLWRLVTRKFNVVETHCESGFVVCTQRLVCSDGSQLELLHRKWVRNDGCYQEPSAPLGQPKLADS